MKSRIQSLPFFRDLGGIELADNRVVKSGILFRSSEMSKISKFDSKSLSNDYGIRQCIDLRTEEEVEISPDVHNENIRLIHIPLMNNEENPAVTKKTRVEILKRRRDEGGMKKHITSIYRKIVTEPHSIEGLKTIFRILLSNDKEEGIIYHCTQGKDRTGMVSALIFVRTWSR